MGVGARREHRHSRCKGLEGKEPCPKSSSLTPLSHSTSIHQEITLALLSKYIYPKSKHFAPQPSWSCQWLWGGGLGGHEAQRQELSRHTHPQRGGDRTKSCRNFQACQGLWTKHRGTSMASWTRGRGYPKRGKESDLCFRKTQ